MRTSSSPSSWRMRRPGWSACSASVKGTGLGVPTQGSATVAALTYRTDLSTFIYEQHIQIGLSSTLTRRSRPAARRGERPFLGMRLRSST